MKICKCNNCGLVLEDMNPSLIVGLPPMTLQIMSSQNEVFDVKPNIKHDYSTGFSIDKNLDKFTSSLIDELRLNKMENSVKDRIVLDKNVPLDTIIKTQEEISKGLKVSVYWINTDTFNRLVNTDSKFNTLTHYFYIIRG